MPGPGGRCPNGSFSDRPGVLPGDSAEPSAGHGILVVLDRHALGIYWPDTQWVQTVRPGDSIEVLDASGEPRLMTWTGVMGKGIKRGARAVLRNPGAGQQCLDGFEEHPPKGAEPRAAQPPLVAGGYLHDRSKHYTPKVDLRA